MTTASSVASTVAENSGSSSPSPTVSLAGRGEGDEDLAAAVVRDRAGAREPEARAARDPLQLLGAQLRVDGDDHDAAAGGARAAAARRRVGQQAPDRYAVDAQSVARRSSPARGRRAVAPAATRLDVPMPPLKSKHVMPGAGADGALGHDGARRVGQRAGRVAGLHLHDARLAEPAVVALGDDRDDDVLQADGRVGRHRGGYGAVEHAADRLVAVR